MGQGLTQACELGWSGNVRKWRSEQILLCDTRNSSHTTRTAALQAIDQTALPHIGKACKVGVSGILRAESTHRNSGQHVKNRPGKGSNQALDEPKYTPVLPPQTLA